MSKLKDFVEGISTNSYSDAKDAVSSIISDKYAERIEGIQEKLGLVSEKKKAKKDKFEDEEFEEREEEEEEEEEGEGKKKKKKSKKEKVEGAVEEAYDSNASRSHEKSSGDAQFKLCSNFQPMAGYKNNNANDNNKSASMSREASTGSAQMKICSNFQPLKGSVKEAVEDKKTHLCMKCKNKKLKKAEENELED
jgi:hypothetical protein